MINKCPIEPAPPSIINLLNKLRQMKDDETDQFSLIIERFTRIHKGDLRIAQVVDRKMNRIEIISSIEREYDCEVNKEIDDNVNKENDGCYEETDIFKAMLLKAKKPLIISNTQNTMEINDDYYRNQFLTNSLQSHNSHYNGIIGHSQPGLENFSFKDNNNIQPLTIITKPLVNCQSQSSFEPITLDIDNSQILSCSLLGKKRPTLVKPIIVSAQNQAPCSKGYGLKDISRRIMEIINRNHKTNYNEISTEIIEGIKVNDKKDEKNIRRRVYDALNVMKALRLFNKDKITKEITMEDKHKEKEEIIREIQRKTVKGNELQLQLANMKRIIERNCSVEKDKKSEDNHDKNIHNRKIVFPFILFQFNNRKECSNDEDNKIHIAMNTTHTQASISFNDCTKLYSYLTILSLIKP